MVRIDFYVQHLVRHNASAIELSSGQPVTFRFAEGNRHSKKPLDHAQLVQVVQEVAPPTALEEIRRGGAASFEHEGGGARVRVTVRATAPGARHVTLSPAGAAAPGPAVRAEVEPVPLPPAEDVEVERPIGGVAAEPIRERTPSVSPPRVDASPDEPRIHRYLREMIAIGASDLHLSSEVPPMVRLHESSGDGSAAT